jgi:hypothetical protein
MLAVIAWLLAMFDEALEWTEADPELETTAGA